MHAQQRIGRPVAANQHGCVHARPVVAATAHRREHASPQPLLNLPCRPPSLLLGRARADALPSTRRGGGGVSAATTTTIRAVRLAPPTSASEQAAAPAVAAAAGAAALESLLFGGSGNNNKGAAAAAVSSSFRVFAQRALAFSPTPALVADEQQCYSGLALLGDAALGVLQSEAGVAVAAAAAAAPGGLNDGGGGGAAAGTAGAGGAGTVATVALSRAYLALTAEAWGLRGMIRPAPMGGDSNTPPLVPPPLDEWRARLGHAALAEVLEAVVGAVMAAADGADPDADDGGGGGGEDEQEADNSNSIGSNGAAAAVDARAARGYARVRAAFGAWMAASHEAVRAAHLRAQAAALRRAADEAAAALTQVQEEEGVSANNADHPSAAPCAAEIAAAARCLEIEAAAAGRSAAAAARRSPLPVVDPLDGGEREGGCDDEEEEEGAAALMEAAVEAAVAQWRQPQPSSSPSPSLSPASSLASSLSSSSQQQQQQQQSARRRFGPAATRAACRRRIALGMLRLDAFLAATLRSRATTRALRARALLQRRRRAAARALAGEGGGHDDEEEAWMWWRGWAAAEPSPAGDGPWAPWPLGGDDDDDSNGDGSDEAEAAAATLRLLLPPQAAAVAVDEPLPDVRGLGVKLQAAFHRAAAPMLGTAPPTSRAAFTSPRAARRAALAALVVLASPAGAGVGAERGHTTCRPLAAATKSLAGLPARAHTAVRGAAALHCLGNAGIRLAAVSRAFWGADEAALLLSLDEEGEEEGESDSDEERGALAGRGRRRRRSRSRSPSPSPSSSPSSSSSSSSRRRRAAASPSLAGRLTSAASALCTTRHRCRMAAALVDPDDGWVPLSAPFRDARFKAQKNALSAALDAAVGSLLADAGPGAAMALAGGLLASTSALRDGVDLFSPAWANKDTWLLKKRLRGESGVVSSR